MIPLLLTLALLPQCVDAPRGSEAISLAPGIVRVETRMDDAPVHLIRVRPGAARWRFIRSETPEETLRVGDLETQPSLLAAVNGGYFDVDGSPMGLMVHDGRKLNPMRKADWGVFWLDRKGRGHLHHRRMFSWSERRKDVDFAVECGPRVLVKGALVKVRPGKARRTLIGTRKDGELLLVVFPTAVDLRDAGRWLREEWEVQDLLNLDGGSSTQLGLREGDGWRTVASGVSVPVFVGLYPVDGKKEEKKN